ncbi:hypothetical protein [Marinoscillum sp.]|uniref:hypothetical protein n=1 Tax=Marinoscillum sp. TaxID=2024838 RepID=UPI003BA9604A
MKKRYIIIILAIGGFYSMLYFWHQEDLSVEQHPTINSPAAKPDDYLLEAKDYEDEQRHDKSANSIEQAIQAIWKLETDVDDKSFERLEQTIQKLEAVHKRIIRDSIPSAELLKAFEYALSNLARAELEVAQKYSTSDKLDESRSALKYAQLHIKNALMLHNSDRTEDSIQQAIESQLVDEIDNLSNQEDLSQEQYLAALDKLMKEVDHVIAGVDE